MKKENKKRGFTLVEVILAVAIIAIAMLPLLGSFVTAARLNAKGRQKEQAMTVAQNVMEGVKACGIENAYLWAEGTGSGYSVVPANADGTSVTTKGTKTDKTDKYDLSGVTVAGGSTLGDDYKDVNIVTNTYSLQIDGILFGKTKYDALVIIEQDTENLDNMAALALESKFNSLVGGLRAMKYYKVTVTTYPTGVLKDAENVIATYSGSVISKGATTASAETTETTEASET